MGGWWDHYSFRCQPVDYSNSPTAIRVSVPNRSNPSRTVQRDCLPTTSTRRLLQQKSPNRIESAWYHGYSSINMYFCRLAVPYLERRLAAGANIPGCDLGVRFRRPRAYASFSSSIESLACSSSASIQSFSASISAISTLDKKSNADKSAECWTCVALPLGKNRNCKIARDFQSLSIYSLTEGIHRSVSSRFFRGQLFFFIQLRFLFPLRRGIAQHSRARVRCKYFT